MPANIKIFASSKKRKNGTQIFVDAKPNLTCPVQSANIFFMENYYQDYINTIKKIDTNKKPKLLLHVCCAPCSSHCLEVLEPYFDVTVFFYNPNISPKAEYDKRLFEEQNFVKTAHPNTKVVEAQYDSQNFFAIAKGLEDLPEGGERCHRCYELRLKKTAEYAKQNGFDYFTTTLTISPYKNSKVLNEIGGNVAKQYGAKYLFSDFKKENGYLHSIELSHKYNLYRQNYCGCIFSKMAREKFEKSKDAKSGAQNGTKISPEK